MEHIGRIKIVKKDMDIMKSICLCPRCGREILYAQMMMISGTNCCPHCHDELYEEIIKLKESNYDEYVRLGTTHEDEPYRWTPENDIK